MFFSWPGNCQLDDVVAVAVAVAVVVVVVVVVVVAVVVVVVVVVIILVSAHFVIKNIVSSLLVISCSEYCYYKY